LVTVVTSIRVTALQNRVMTTLTAELTVGELAARLPGSVRVFEKHQIDFCCGGTIPLEAACARRGLNPAAVLEEIEAANAAPYAHTTDWQSAGLDVLLDHILSTHHKYMKTELPRLEGMLAKVTAAHGERHGDLLRSLAAVFAPMKEELDGHLMKEEMVLFPLIRSLELANQTGTPAPWSHCGSVRNPLRVMLMEHDSAGAALVRMRGLTGDYTAPRDACNTFLALYSGLEEMEADLHRHIHLENNILFPKALALE
jgi:regulator of cell morphogenesis and NO signaling